LLPEEGEIVINIYLDDSRPVPKGFILVKDVRNCTMLLMDNKNKVNILSLDHDLGEEPTYETGYDVVKFLINQYYLYNINYFPKKIYLHSANPVGRMNMLQLLERYKPDDVKVYNSPIEEFKSIWS
jgi:hypothetical protein